MVLGILLLGRALVAHAAPPSAPISEAIISPDGAYELTIQPQQPWLAAEVSVAGDRAVDVEAAESGAAIQIAGELSGTGPLWITVTAALDAAHGVTWVYAIDPEVVPVLPPKMRRLTRREIPWCSRFRRQR